jgi:isoquinoline 1-oxidoreductase subunit beta
MENKKFSRRKFLQRGAIVMGGTVVATYLSAGPLRRFIAGKAESMDLPAGLSTLKPDFWFEVLADNTILLKSPKIEMGQGILTGLAMMAAEELEVPLDQIKVEHASTSKGSIDDLGTGGSTSTLSLYKPLREVAATMREMLKTAAAKQWNVKIENITAQNGTLTSGKHTAKYAEIAAATKDWEVPKTPELKPKSAFKYIGTNQKRYDLKSKVMATAKYTIDSQLPDMLHALTLESPYFEGKIKTIDTSKAETSANVVKVVREGELVAVVAKTRYAADVAIQKIIVTWDVPKKWQQADIEALVSVGKTKPTNIQQVGDAVGLIESSKTVFKQEYRTPIATHAPMEVFGAVADVQKDKTTIIIGTQTPAAIQKQVAKELGIDKEQVDVQIPYLGGGFGRKTPKNYASVAAKLSKMMGKPVKIIPSREQEFQNSLYRPNTHHVLQAKIAPNGSIEAIAHDQATPDVIVKTLFGQTALNALGADWVSAGHGAGILYHVPNKSANVWNVEVPFPAGIWRGVGMFPNTFAIESFMDELATETQKDPIALRLELLKVGDDEVTERMAKALETLQEKSGWKTPKAEGIGRGVAVCSDRKGIAAAAIEVVVVDGKIQVKKVTTVIDVGFAINPEGIKAQVEGAAMMGISAGLYEEIQIKDGQIPVTNYHLYPLAKLSDTPDIQIVILENADEPYGVGEPPISPIAPAIANAVFDLTKKRLRNLPLQRALDSFV